MYVCVYVKMKQTGGQRQTVGERDDQAVDWQLQRSSSAHAAVPTETVSPSGTQPRRGGGRRDIAMVPCLRVLNRKSQRKNYS